MHNLLETPLALLAGLMTIASPCILPVLPILLGTSVDRPGRMRPLFIVAGFILTFASFAMLLGAASSAVHLAQDAIRNTAIVLLALSGLLRLWPRPYEWLAAHLQTPLQHIGAAVARGNVHETTSRFVPCLSGALRRCSSLVWLATRRSSRLALPPAGHVQNGEVIPRTSPGAQAGSGNAGGFMLGMSLGAVWTPCAGPVLASILVLVVKAQDLGWSALLLTLYAVGAAIPMLAIIYGGQYMTRRVRAVARHAQRLQQMFGVLVMLTALAIYLQYDIVVYARIAAFFPSLKGL